MDDDDRTEHHQEHEPHHPPSQEELDELQEHIDQVRRKVEADFGPDGVGRMFADLSLPAEAKAPDQGSPDAERQREEGPPMADR